MPELPKTNTRPLSLTVFGWLLIVSSVVHMHTLAFHYEWYHDNYNYWPEWVFNVRYCFSWLQRILGIYVGIGLLNGRELARKLGIFISVFTILGQYWKHHYPAFVRHCQYLDSLYPDVFQKMGYPEISFTSLALPSLIVHILLDLIFFGTLIYVLTRPSVKAYFLNAGRQ